MTIVTGPLIQPGEADAEFPVGTLLVAEAPPAVQQELFTGTPIEPLQGIQVPESFDCRQQWPGLISEPYHQGSCGSCWAFASSMAVSDRIRIKNPNNLDLKKRFLYRPFAPGVQYPVLNNLSAYSLVSCDTCGRTFSSFPVATEYVTGADRECDDGCQGGYLQLVYNFLMTTGVPALLSAPTSCDPTIQQCPCRAEPGAVIYKAGRVYSLATPGQPALVRQKIMEDIFQKGPVSVGFAVYQSFYDFFQRNPRGVYSNRVRPPNDRKIGGHAVDIIGWGTEQGTGVFYWICRNSWGIAWGDQGFFKIQYDFEGILQNVMANDPPLLS